MALRGWPYPWGAAMTNERNFGQDKVPVTVGLLDGQT